MKTFTKTHKLKKVAEIHKAKIKARGGKATMTKTKTGYTLKYSFTPKKSKR